MKADDSPPLKIETFETFESLFSAAISDGIIERPASYQSKLNLYNFEFNQWLHDTGRVTSDKVTPEKVTANKVTHGKVIPDVLTHEEATRKILDYKPHLTPANFALFLKEKTAKAESKQSEQTKRKSDRWQIEPKQAESWSDLFAVEDWSKYMDILCDTDPPILIKDSSGQYRPAKGIKKGVIGKAFYFFVDKGKLKTTSGKGTAKLVSILLDYKIHDGSCIDFNKHWKETFEKQVKKAYDLLTSK
jgi:hypothetical protein